MYGAGLLGIVLTGANQDGAAGLNAVHRAGGLAVVQDPSSALAPLMPESALRRTQADFTGTLGDIAAWLRTLETHDVR